MDMQSLVDRITKDVVDSLKNQPLQECVKTEKPLSACGNVAVIVDEPINSGQWKILFDEFFNGCTVSVFNFSSAAPPPHSSLKEVLVSEEDCLRRLSSFQAVYYVATKIYQISALANLMDNIRGIYVFLQAKQNCPQLFFVNLSENTGGFSKISQLLSDIQALGVSIYGGKSAPVSVSSSYLPFASGKCDGDKGECSGCGCCASLVPKKVEAVVGSGAQRVSSAPGKGQINKELALMIDHTLLKPDAKKEDIIKLCEEAREYVFASVCVNPGYVKLAADCLQGSPVKVCTVVGFPLGATTSVTKAMETRDAIANGADEIDMVLNVGALKAGNYDLVKKDIEAVVEAAAGKLVKVILETALLTDEEKVIGCEISKAAGADFVKTSTGFGPGGATAKDIALMRQTVGKYMGVKASGGVRDLAGAQEMVKAGATRIGASASVAIVKGEKGKSAY